ncbi:MAG TPA: VPLPA-CTERM-specific exosortase XrtD, partial [Dongiaceae bacterium]|nr:VPLPA-CTERM-specific exosortase XrtD [Dongiaceae bacterium]
RLFDISVYLEGNVIDLGSMKLQVVEACSGLRYLFPLMALSLILAIFFKGPLWMRVLIFFSSMPVTVFMNSFRIGVIGVTVEYWGKEMAEGFLHDFEGWVVFMSALLVLLLEIFLVMRLTGDRRPLMDVLALELPAPRDSALPTRSRSIPTPFYVAAAILLAFTFVNQSMMVTDAVHPMREKLDRFPLLLGDRVGTTSVLEGIYLQELQLDDYLLADYRSTTSQSINFYVAYYDVQAEGAGTIHSPRSCLPGSGWRIKEITQQPLTDIQISGVPLTVNRAIIAKDSQQVLVYYWMQQRGRVITNEFMAKWWIFWDRLTKGRSDGALVRVMVELDAFGNVDAAEQQLRRFVAEAAPHLPRFIPD